MFMTHRNTVTTQGLAQDLYSCEYDTPLNLTVQMLDESEGARRYNQGPVTMTSVGFSIFYVPYFRMLLLCNNGVMPTTTL